MSENTSVAFVFPGQGAQMPGMGKDLYDNFASARDVFKEADEALGVSLSRLCFDGPEEELDLTINTQPAMLTVSIACMRAIEEMVSGGFPAPTYLAGHSLGEYTALIVAGIIDFPTGVRLARERGRLMHEAGLNSPGGMLAILGLEEELVAEVCSETGTSIANYNSPGQIVISGAIADLPAAMQLAHEKGASRTVSLQVSGAFHSSLMKPAQEALAEIISGIEFKTPSVPIVANVSALPLTAAEEVKQELIDQICSSIRWQQSVQYMIDGGISAFIEIGQGKVLTGLIKRIDRGVTIHNIGSAEAIMNLVPESL